MSKMKKLGGVLVAFLIIGGVIFTLMANKATSLEWGDLVFDQTYKSMKKAGVKKVLFPHWFHRVRFKCKACHSHIFKMKRGSNKMNMGGIIAGDWCGNCHNGSIAFSPIHCDRCHSYTEDKGLDALWKDHRKKEKQEEARKAAKEAAEAAADADDEDEEEDEDPADLFVRKVKIDANSPVFLTTDGRQGSTGRPWERRSKAARLGILKKVRALSTFPKDRFGLIDWVKSMKVGKIAPIAGINPKFNKDKFEDYVQIFKAKSDFLEDVPFPHNVHTYLIDCGSCHPSPFISKEGKNPSVKMAGFKEGKWCGKCHGKVAFPLDDCHRCHTREKMAEK